MAAPAEIRTRSTRLPRSARRAQLLVAAQEVFVAQGYHAAAMDDIAERAGVSKPVLYQHFPGKLRVAATIEAYFRFVDEDGGAFRLVFESDLTNQPEVRERVEGVTAACADAISEVIRDDAGLPPDQARLLAVGLTGMAQVSARYWLAVDGKIPRDAAARLLASLSWRGIGGFPRTGEPH